jgi:serine/threonine protein kinase
VPPWSRRAMRSSWFLPVLFVAHNQRVSILLAESCLFVPEVKNDMVHNSMTPTKTRLGLPDSISEQKIDDAPQIQLETEHCRSPNRIPIIGKTTIVQRSPLPEIASEDVTLGGVLGTGGFSTVYRVTCASGNESSEICEYALKRLDEDIEDLGTAVADLICEAKILSEIPYHKNIIRLHAVSTSFWDEPQEGFLILEQMADTLHDRLALLRRRPTQNAKARMSQIAPCIARAMEFLHKNRVIYRDLKPQNVGFDAKGNIKLFDFGLARFHIEGQRKLTGRTGSVRYMAPEIARGQEYSFPADVYSYSILVWEVCTLQKAYASAVSVSRLLKQVAYGKVRPSLERIDCPDTQELLTRCWHPDPDRRPPFAKIVRHAALRQDVKKAPADP